MPVNWRQDEERTVRCVFELEDQEYYSLASYQHGDGKIYLPSNYTLVCPICGYQWAKRTILHEQARRFWPLMQPCLPCGHGFMWLPFNENWNRSFPKELLHRELEVLHMHIEAGRNTYSLLFPTQPTWRAI